MQRGSVEVLEVYSVIQRVIQPLSPGPEVLENNIEAEVLEKDHNL